MKLSDPEEVECFDCGKPFDIEGCTREEFSGNTIYRCEKCTKKLFNQGRE